MKYLIPSLLLACTEVSINKIPNEPSDSTSPIVDTTELEPSIEPSPEPSDSMTDLTVGFAEIHFKQIACPACVGAPSEFDISARLNLHYPTAGDYVSHLTPIDTCTTNLYETHVGVQPLNSSQPAYFNGIMLNPIGPGEWANYNLYEHQYQRNTSHNIISENGDISNAFTTIEGFDSIDPYTLLWVDPSYAFETIISKSSTTFTWAPVVSNSQFEIIIAVYSTDGSQYLGAVSCMQEDSGQMTIPGSYFQSYPTWALASVHFIRHRNNILSAEQLNGVLQSHMIWEVVGTGHIE